MRDLCNNIVVSPFLLKRFNSSCKMKVLIVVLILLISTPISYAQDSVFIWEQGQKIMGKFLFGFVEKKGDVFYKSEFSIRYKKNKIVAVSYFPKGYDTSSVYELIDGDIVQKNMGHEYRTYSSTHFSEHLMNKPVAYDIIAKDFLNLPNFEKLKILTELYDKYKVIVDSKHKKM